MCAIFVYAYCVHNILSLNLNVFAHFILEASGGSTDSNTPIQEVSDRLHESFHPDVLADGVSNIQVEDSIDTSGESAQLLQLISAI